MTYEFDLLVTFKIHFVIFVIMLKSTNVLKFFYNRFKFDYSNLIKIDYENNVNANSRYEIEKIIKRRQRIFDRIKI